MSRWSNILTFWTVAFPLVVDASADSLRLVHVVFRHGERTPASTYPNDPHINETFSPYGWGHLTNEGKLQSYRQGQWLRNTYGDFLGDYYSDDQLEAHSTQVARAQMTASLTLAGLFPPVGNQIWSSELLWQPIPLEIQPLKKDRLLLTRDCPRFNQLLSQLLNSPEERDKQEDNRDFYSYIAFKAGFPVKNPYDVEDIYSTLKAEEGLNLSLPDWTKNVYPTKMMKDAARTFTLNTLTKDLKRLKGGPLIKKILLDSKAKANGQSKKKMYVYSGHDATVANVLSVLGCWEEQMPPYNTMAIFELHQSDSGYNMKVKLRNSTTHEPYDLNIPNCPDPCPLEKVWEIATPFLTDDLDKECQMVDGSFEVMPDAVQP